MSYEPKWDGFRCIVFRDGDEVELASRGGKTLTRYFPEVVEQAKAQLPPRCAVDGEIVVIHREDGQQPKLEWDWLTQRIHPAATRVKLLAEKTPADFVAFDLLALGDESLIDQPYATRRARLEKALAKVAAAGAHHADHRRPRDRAALVRDLRGRRARRADRQAGRHRLRAQQAADVQDQARAYGRRGGRRLPLAQVRPGRSVRCCSACTTSEGTLHHVGVSASFSMARRAELLDELAATGSRAEHPWIDADSDEQQIGPTSATGQRRPGGVSRWTGGKNLSCVPLRPELVVEVGYDSMEGDRFRHTAQFERWRPDRDPRSCTYDQLDRPVRFDVDEVLGGDRLPPATGVS